MRKKTGIKICSVIFALVIIFCIIAGRITAHSYKDNVELDKYLIKMLKLHITVWDMIR